MAYIRANQGGGISSIDLTAPDVTYSNLVSSGTSIINVTQKPRYILMMVIPTGYYTGQMGIIDVKNNIAKRSGYWSSNNYDMVSWDNVSSFFPTIIDTEVHYNNATWGASHRIYINIYY